MQGPELSPSETAVRRGEGRSELILTQAVTLGNYVLVDADSKVIRRIENAMHGAKRAATKKAAPKAKSARATATKKAAAPKGGGAKKAGAAPVKLTDRQRELLEALSREMGADTHPQQQSFLDKLIF